jgi:glutamate mutase epsilon subunit
MQLWSAMLAFLRRLFPDRIFRHKLEPAAERRLRLAQARAEEAIIRAHVDNALMFVDTLAEDMSFDRAIDSYIREMAIPEPLASTVATRTLVVLGQDVVPYRRRAVDAGDAAPDRPKLRLNDASQGRGQQRTIKRA